MSRTYQDMRDRESADQELKEYTNGIRFDRRINSGMEPLSIEDVDGTTGRQDETWP